MKYQYLFGPVPSRRLGFSLGVDLVPFKTCSFNCLYCECGSTTRLTSRRKEFVPLADVIREVDHFLRQGPNLDYITFSGSGEPTLHSGIGKIITYLKEHYPKYKVALLTNASLFSRKNLRKELGALDLVVPSLDACSDEVFQKINRPEGSIHVPLIVKGLVAFRKEFSGQLWLEIFILPGINDHPEEMARIRDAVHSIQPDKVQLNTLDRPGAVSWVKPASRSQLEEIARYLDYSVEIVARLQETRSNMAVPADIQHTLYQMIQRRPCTIEDMSLSLGVEDVIVRRYVKDLCEKRKIQGERRERGVFYKMAGRE